MSRCLTPTHPVGVRVTPNPLLITNRQIDLHLIIVREGASHLRVGPNPSLKAVIMPMLRRRGANKVMRLRL